MRLTAVHTNEHCAETRTCRPRNGRSEFRTTYLRRQHNTARHRKRQHAGSSARSGKGRQNGLPKGLRQQERVSRTRVHDCEHDVRHGLVQQINVNCDMRHDTRRTRQAAPDRPGGKLHSGIQKLGKQGRQDKTHHTHKPPHDPHFRPAGLRTRGRAAKALRRAAARQPDELHSLVAARLRAGQGFPIQLPQLHNAAKHNTAHKRHVVARIRTPQHIRRTRNEPHRLHSLR